MSGLRAGNVLRSPSPPLRGLVTGYNAFSYHGSPGGIHYGLPSRHLTVVISVGQPIVVDRSAGLDGDGAYRSLVTGLRSRPVPIRHRDQGSGVIVSLSPLGAGRLFGVSAGVLAGRVAHLEEVLGAAAVELSERVAEASGCQDRLAVVDQFLQRLLQDQAEPRAEVRAAWRRLESSGGRTRVETLATEVGWSRRHLENRFRAEFGLGVKEAARVLRFERAVAALARRPVASLAGIAVDCGYYDQAHLANEWRRLAGLPVTEWLHQELRDPPPLAAA